MARRRRLWTRQAPNQVFLGCNYNDKRLKSQFDKLKTRLEETTSLRCIVVDKQKGQAARDLWRNITESIDTSDACVFDLTGFRPNVVLELGYALSTKAEEQVFITFRKRRSKGQRPDWLLSDISHLNRLEYVDIPQLEQFIRTQLEQIPYSAAFTRFERACEETGAVQKYREQGLRVLQRIRDEGPQSDQQLRRLISGSSCRSAKLLTMLKKQKLVRRSQGRNGKFRIPEDEF